MHNGGSVPFWCAPLDEEERPLVAAIQGVERVQVEAVDPAFMTKKTYTEYFKSNCTVPNAAELNFMIWPQDDVRFKLLELHRLGTAIRHIVGPAVPVESNTELERRSLVFWYARRNKWQKGRIEDTDGVSTAAAARTAICSADPRLTCDLVDQISLA